MSDQRTKALEYLHQLAESEPELPLERHRRSAGRLNRSKTGAQRPSAERAGRLGELEKSASQCTRCPLSENRLNVVFGVGDPDARLVFVGEAPGVEEDRQGEPFVGRAGQMLNRILAAMGLQRREVYIANILKCRPPENRNPLPSESAACIPYLREQIELIAPEVVVALGLVAATHLMNIRTTVSLKELRGRIFDYSGRPLVVTYHPAALLRSASYKLPTWQDMQMIMKLLAGEIAWQPAEGNLSLEGMLLV